MQRLAASEIQKQAFWLLGVLMGVAIKEAITSFYTEFISGDEPQSGLGVARLCVLLLVSLRFYFGSVQYFSAVYDPPVSTGELRRRRFGADLFFGLLQFGIVCCWGLSVALFDHRWPMFPALLLAILLCDVFWYLLAPSDTRVSWNWDALFTDGRASKSGWARRFRGPKPTRVDSGRTTARGRVVADGDKFWRFRRAERGR